MNQLDSLIGLLSDKKVASTVCNVKELLSEDIEKNIKEVTKDVAKDISKEVISDAIEKVSK